VSSHPLVTHYHSEFTATRETWSRGTRTAFYTHVFTALDFTHLLSHARARARARTHTVHTATNTAPNPHIHTYSQPTLAHAHAHSRPDALRGAAQE
jgi:hypothetical protein